MNKSNEQYIEHEVKLRLHDHRFKMLESKLNFLIGIGISGVILPVILHWVKLI
jgi:hypothetical protein